MLPDLHLARVVKCLDEIICFSFPFGFFCSGSMLDVCQQWNLCPGGLGHEEWPPDIVWHWEMAVGRQSLGAKAFLK